jgi:hypothetical protein
MKIKNIKDLVEGKEYYMFDITLSSKGDKLMTKTKPTKYIYVSQEGNRYYRCNFRKVLKKGNLSKNTKSLYVNTGTNEIHYGDIYPTLNECSDAFDKKCEELMKELYKRQMDAKKIYDSLDAMKIKLRGSKLARIVETVGEED